MSHGPWVVLFHDTIRWHLSCELRGSVPLEREKPGCEALLRMAGRISKGRKRGEICLEKHAHASGRETCFDFVWLRGKPFAAKEWSVRIPKPGFLFDSGCWALVWLAISVSIRFIMKHYYPLIYILWFENRSVTTDDQWLRVEWVGILFAFSFQSESELVALVMFMWWDEPMSQCDIYDSMMSRDHLRHERISLPGLRFYCMATSDSKSSVSFEMVQCSDGQSQGGSAHYINEFTQTKVRRKSQSLNKSPKEKTSFWIDRIFSWFNNSMIQFPRQGWMGSEWSILRSSTGFKF